MLTHVSPLSGRPERVKGGSRSHPVGGRVLSVVALGATLETARERAYEAVERINLEDAQYRTDIAQAASEGSVSSVGSAASADGAE